MIKLRNRAPKIIYRNTGIVFFNNFSCKLTGFTNMTCANLRSLDHNCINSLHCTVLLSRESVPGCYNPHPHAPRRTIKI